MVDVSNQLQRELPKLSARKSVGVVNENRYPVRNKLAEQNNRPMNQTYTLGTKPLINSTTSNKGRERSCSIDSDIAEYTINGAITGLFPRNYTNNTLTKTSSNQSFKSSSFIAKNDIQRIFSTKLPSLDGCSPERKCCQRPFGRAQIDLQKYKETIKNAS